jgi:hypothetical protein
MRARWALVGLLAVGLAGCIGVLGDFEVSPTAGGADATPDDATSGNDGTTSGDSTVTDGAPPDTFRSDAGFDAPGPCGHENEQCCRTQPECVLGYACQTGVCARIRPTDFGRPCDAGFQCEAGVCVNNPNGSVCGSACNQTNECPGANWQCSNGGPGQPPKVCKCQTTNLDVCDGMDNDCNGIVDDRATADPYCKQARGGTGYVCANGQCQCMQGALNCPSSSCVDGQNDVNNCGKCGHYCNNGSGTGCTNGMCDPFVWYNFGSGVQIDKIKAGSTGYIHMAIQTLVDGGTLAPSIVRCGSGSGACPQGSVQVVTTPVAAASDLLMDEPGGAPPLYWAADNPPGMSGGVYSCQPDAFTGQCGAITYYAQSGYGVSVFSEIAHDANNLYFHDLQQNQIRTVAFNGPKPETSPAPIYSPGAGQNIVHFVLYQNQAYMTEYSATQSNRRLTMCSTGNCYSTLTTWAMNMVTPGFVSVDSSRVYWSDKGDNGNFGTVRSCPHAGCGNGNANMVTYTNASAATGASMPTEVIADNTNVYWLADATGGNALFSCPTSGCVGAPKVVASGMSMRVLAQDNENLYWVQGFGGTIWRVRKP